METKTIGQKCNDAPWLPVGTIVEHEGALWRVTGMRMAGHDCNRDICRRCEDPDCNWNELQLEQIEPVAIDWLPR